jgi:hypothetical protein
MNRESLESIALDFNCSAPTVARHTAHLGPEFNAPTSRPKYDEDAFYQACLDGCTRTELQRLFNMSRDGVRKARKRLREQGKHFESNRSGAHKQTPGVRKRTAKTSTTGRGVYL